MSQALEKPLNTRSPPHSSTKKGALPALEILREVEIEALRTMSDGST